MLNSIPGKDPCPNCGELLIANTSTDNHAGASHEAICSVCKVSFNELERIEARRAISGGASHECIFVPCAPILGSQGRICTICGRRQELMETMP